MISFATKGQFHPPIKGDSQSATHDIRMINCWKESSTFLVVSNKLL